MTEHTPGPTDAARSVSADERRRVRSRLQAAASLVLTVAALVVMVVAEGCGPPSPAEADKEPTTGPTTTPTTSPTSTATSSPTAFTGTFGPGTFTRGAESCNFFAASFSGSILVINDVTFASLFESQRRDSTCMFNSSTRLATCTGNGTIGGQAVSWTLLLQYNTAGTSLMATESLRIGTCTSVFTSGNLNKL